MRSVSTTERRSPSDHGRQVRRGRPPKGASQLSRAAILDAALEVIDTEGIAAITMRSVARRLGVDAKSLYNHVDDKDDLLDAVAEHVLAGMDIPEPTGAPEADLRAIAVAFRARTLRYPQAATLVLTRQLSSLAGLAPLEAVLSVLRAAGCSVEESVHLLRTFVATLIGTLLREVNAGPTFGLSDAEGIARRQTVLEQSGLPAVGEAAAYLARLDREAEFAFTIDLAIGTVLARLPGTNA
ncbi:TetR family transcriptional regulator [Nocardia lijiangensis]|uniref:TetR family transcriptional regulator n=1 Tax=Nocardia lijiangensis TaxID=299618 RepID=UPI00082E1728